MAAKTSADPEVKMLRELAELSNSHLLQKAFEKIGCPCREDRVKLESLEQKLKEFTDGQLKELKAFEKELDIHNLRQSIRDTDAREHGPLNEQARYARPFFGMWVKEMWEGGNTR